MELENIPLISNKTIPDLEVTYDDDTTSNKSTKFVQVEHFL